MTSGASCGTMHCVTCSDEGVPMTVTGVLPDGIATCATVGGEVSEVMADLVGPVAAGDVLLVHAGTAIARLEAGAA